MKFEVGDKVLWCTPCPGENMPFSAGHIGKVFAIVEPNTNPYNYIGTEFKPYSSRGFGKPRNHRSYLVQLGKSKRLYWPLVQYLIDAQEVGW